MVENPDSWYNPNMDLAPVSQEGIIDAHTAFETGFIPDDLVAPDTEFDGNEDPRAIFGRPANQFEAIHMHESLRSAVKDSETSE